MQGFLRVFGVFDTATGLFTIEVSFQSRIQECLLMAIQTRFQQLITSLLQVGLIISSAAVGPLSKSLGRRAILLLASALSCLGLTIQIVVTIQWPVYIGRLLLGKSCLYVVSLCV